MNEQASGDDHSTVTLTPHLSIVVPAYNEIDRIGGSLKRMMEYFDAQSYAYEILVIDDGSTDGTLDLVKSLAGDHEQVSAFHYDGNRGKGYAVRYGILRSKGKFILFSDADLATPIEEVEHLFEGIKSGCDVAIGSRDVVGSKLEKRQSVIRELGGKVFNKLVQKLAVPGIHDTQCGFKLFTHHAAYNIFSCCQVDNFSFDVEALYLSRQFNFSIAEIPVRWHHVEGSKVRVVRDSVRMLRTLYKIRATDYQKKISERTDASASTLHL
ncbi:MAG: dolichyl-phosphate beta-glucosyltransferase [Chthonomonadales bacterium]